MLCRCLLIDTSGYLVYHPDFVTTGENPEWVHLGRKVSENEGGDLLRDAPLLLFLCVRVCACLCICMYSEVPVLHVA